MCIRDRIATAEDREQVKQNRVKEKEAFDICQEKISAHGLPMNLVEVEYTFDRGKIIFYFTADGRVDFRELVRDLAAVFRTRIELRQIGVRDEAKLIGGLGPVSYTHLDVYKRQARDHRYRPPNGRGSPGIGHDGRSNSGSRLRRGQGGR